MSKIKRINVMTPANILADALAKVKNYESVIVIGINAAGEAMIGFSNQTEPELAYALLKFDDFIRNKICSDEFERVL